MTRNQKYYRRGKEKARALAIEWQYRFAMGELDTFGEDYYFCIWEWADYFRKLGRRFGLTREFRENAII